MSFPTYSDIFNEHKMNIAKEYIQDKELIKKAMSEYYIDKMSSKISENKNHILNGWGFAVHLRQSDRDTIKDKSLLCNTMNEFLHTKGYNFNVNYQYYNGGMYDNPTSYCNFK